MGIDGGGDLPDSWLLKDEDQAVHPGAQAFGRRSPVIDGMSDLV